MLVRDFPDASDGDSPLPNLVLCCYDRTITVPVPPTGALSDRVFARAQAASDIAVQSWLVQVANVARWSWSGSRKAAKTAKVAAWSAFCDGAVLRMRCNAYVTAMLASHLLVIRHIPQYRVASPSAT